MLRSFMNSQQVLPGAILAHKAEAFRDLTRSCHAESGNPAGCRPRSAGGMSVTAILNPTRASSHARRGPNLAQQFESDAGPTKARPGQAVRPGRADKNVRRGCSPQLEQVEHGCPATRQALRRTVELLGVFGHHSSESISCARTLPEWASLR
jgi:hypothetical protein